MAIFNGKNPLFLWPCSSSQTVKLPEGKGGKGFSWKTHGRPSSSHRDSSPLAPRHAVDSPAGGWLVTPETIFFRQLIWFIQWKLGVSRCHCFLWNPTPLSAALNRSSSTIREFLVLKIAFGYPKIPLPSHSSLVWCFNDSKPTMVTRTLFWSNDPMIQWLRWKLGESSLDRLSQSTFLSRDWNGGWLGWSTEKSTRSSRDLFLQNWKCFKELVWTWSILHEHVDETVVFFEHKSWETNKRSFVELSTLQLSVVSKKWAPNAFQWFHWFHAKQNIQQHGDFPKMDPYPSWNQDPPWPFRTLPPANVVRTPPADWLAPERNRRTSHAGRIRFKPCQTDKNESSHAMGILCYFSMPNGSMTISQYG